MTQTFTRAEKRAEALYEVGQRRRVYRRLVEEGRMKPEVADTRIAKMQAIADDYAEPDLFAAADPARAA